MEIITGVERRRRWRDEEKLRILAEVVRWPLSVGQFDGLDKLGPGCRQAANFSTSFTA
jgi:hypothetical protein